MGQTTSQQVHEFLSPLVSQILVDNDCSSLLSAEIRNLSYEDFLRYLGDLNTLTKKYLDCSGKQLVFAVRKGSDSSPLWKATVEIACVKIDPETSKVDTFRLLSLTEFLKVFKTLTCQYNAAQQSFSVEAGSSNPITASTIFNELQCISDKDRNNVDGSTECCICLERQPEILLPCAHSYCTQCIEEWKEYHDTCPICRNRLESTDDSWVLSEVPKADEISREIRENLSDLTKDSSPPCSPI